MTGTSLTSVSFQDSTLYGYLRDGEAFVALRPIVDALGLNWASQYKRVRRDPNLARTVVIMTTVTPRGDRETLCLALRALNGWLFGISTGSIRDPAIRARVLTYQRECYDVLADHFLGPRVGPATRHDAQPMALRRRALEIAQVKLALRLKGKAHALALHRHFGLPLPEPAPVDQGDARAAIAALRAFCDAACLATLAPGQPSRCPAPADGRCLIHPPASPAGYRTAAHLYLTEAAMSAALGDLDPPAALDALATAGILLKDGPHRKRKVTTPAGRQRLYVLVADRLTPA